MEICCYLHHNLPLRVTNEEVLSTPNNVHSFLQAANKRDGFMPCPCGVCKNNKTYSNSIEIHGHMFTSGFMSGYNCWTKHGERGVLMEENEEEEDDDSYPGFPEYDGTTMGEENEE